MGNRMISFEDLEDVLDDIQKGRYKNAENKVTIMLEEETKKKKGVEQ